jgi:large conductance mechanosensitive channel
MGSAKNLVREFQAFVMRGNVLDLAVAVILGAAFNVVVNSLVKNIILRLIGAIAGKPNFSDLYFTINKSQIAYGQFITDLLNFIIIAASVFLIIKTFNTLQARRGKAPEDGPAPTDETLILGEIRDLLSAQANGGSAAPTSAP